MDELFREQGEPTEEQTEEFLGSLLDFDEFEWDEKKAEVNLAKHGVSFEEASTAVCNAEWISEPYQQRGEGRMLLTGATSVGRTLDVVITMRDRNVRIISARRHHR